MITCRCVFSVYEWPKTRVASDAANGAIYLRLPVFVCAVLVGRSSTPLR